MYKKLQAIHLIIYKKTASNTFNAVYALM